jgi:adenine deaminase
MFCSDDKHPDSLLEGHINVLCSRAVSKGIDVFKILQAACVNPVSHYKIDVGQLREGDPADFIVVRDLKNFEVIKTYINGIVVAENGRTNISTPAVQLNEPVNNFNCTKKEPADMVFPAIDGELPVIIALDGQLITERIYLAPKIIEGNFQSDLSNDILKIVVVNRYTDAPVSKAFIKNFGLRSGAIASSVAHDSHNIIAVGVDDESLCKAINLIIQHRGGISCISNHEELILPLPVAGLMSDDDGYKVAEQYTRIDQAAKQLGSKLSAPFMTLSFMALLVIPHLKLSDKGLFDGDRFQLL